MGLLKNIQMHGFSSVATPVATNVGVASGLSARRFVGKGRVLHCWKGRILEDHCVRSGTEIRCACGNLVGIDEKKWIKMKQNAVSVSGSVTRD